MDRKVVPVNMGFHAYLDAVVNRYNSLRAISGGLPVEYIPSRQIYALAEVTYNLLGQAGVVFVELEQGDEETNTG